MGLWSNWRPVNSSHFNWHVQFQCFFSYNSIIAFRFLITNGDWQSYCFRSLVCPWLLMQFYLTTQPFHVHFVVNRIFFTRILYFSVYLLNYISRNAVYKNWYKCWGWMLKDQNIKALWDFMWLKIIDWYVILLVCFPFSSSFIDFFYESQHFRHNNDFYFKFEWVKC